MTSLVTELRRRNVIRVAGAYLVLSWLLLQIGEVTFDFLEVPDWAGKLLIAFLAIGFVPVVMFSWIYELTPEGIKLEKDVDRSRSITHHTAKKLDVVTIVMLIAAVGVVMLDRFVFEEVTEKGSESFSNVAQEENDSDPFEPEPAPSPADEKSVAVLPFINMSPDPDNEYFSDGLSETLLHMLAQVNGLKVAARTSSFAFKGQNKDISEIASTLKVAHILEGSVQKAGDRVRVTAQLIDASEGTHLWSSNFDRDLEDIFAIQDEIARHVVDALKVELLGEDQRIGVDQTHDVEAYQSYLRGLQYLPGRTTAGLTRAIGYFEQAAALDPDYALAHARLYDATMLLAEYGTVTPEQLAASSGALDRALKLAPDLGAVHTSLGVRLRRQGDYVAAEAAFKRAIELAPSYAAAHHFYAHMLRNRLGRFEEALRHHRIAYELDPLSAIIHANVGWSQQALGQESEAKKTFASVIELHPNYPLGPWALGVQAWQYEGDLSEARVWLKRVVEMDPGAVQYALTRCYVLIDLRETGEATACVDEVAGRAPSAPDTLLAQSWLHVVGGRRQAAADAISLLLSSVGNLPSDLKQDAAATLFAARSDADALVLYRTIFPDLFLAEPDFRSIDIRSAVDVGVLLLRMGRSEQGKAILILALERMQNLDRIVGWDRFGWSDVFALAALQRGPEAVGRFRTAVDSGLRAGNRQLDWRPELDAIRDDPEFRSAMADLLADLERQRQTMTLDAAP